MAERKDNVLERVMQVMGNNRLYFKITFMRLLKIRRR